MTDYARRPRCARPRGRRLHHRCARRGASRGACGGDASRASGSSGFGMSATGSPGARRSISRWDYLARSHERRSLRRGPRHRHAHVPDGDRRICRRLPGHVPLALSAHGSLPRSARAARGRQGRLRLALVRTDACGARRCSSLRPITRRELYERARRSTAGRPLAAVAAPADQRRPRLGAWVVPRADRRRRRRAPASLSRPHQPAEGPRLPDRARCTRCSAAGRASLSSAGTTGSLRRSSRGLPALIADGRVRLAGPLYGDHRFAAYVDADVFCLTPPHWEETSRRGSRGCRLRHRRRRERAGGSSRPRRGGRRVRGPARTAGTSATRSKPRLPIPTGSANERVAMCSHSMVATQLSRSSTSTCAR